MPNAPHDILVEVLKDQPELLDRLSRALLGTPLPVISKVSDSTLRRVKAAEVRPDVIFEDGKLWMMVEVQGEPDEEKAIQWLLMSVLMLKDTGAMGELLVVTHSRAVAEWARTVATHVSAFGTTLSLRPVVLLLDVEAAEKLLAEGKPELAFFAAWAMQDRHGPEAQGVVRRALRLSDRLPEPLQEPMKRAILNVLSEKMLSFLKEAAMNPDQIPEGPAMRLFRQEAYAEGEAHGEARGEAKAVLTVLRTRDVAVDGASEQRILASTDLAELDRWLRRAAKATQVEELFADS